MSGPYLAALRFLRTVLWLALGAGLVVGAVWNPWGWDIGARIIGGAVGFTILLEKIGE